jgi:hypothetical protein
MALPIASLVKVVAGVDFRAFEPFLQQTMEIVIALILRGDIDSIADACEAVRDLLPLYDLNPFVPAIESALVAVLEGDLTIRYFPPIVRLFGAMLRYSQSVQPSLEAVPRVVKATRPLVAESAHETRH